MGCDLPLWYLKMNGKSVDTGKKECYYVNILMKEVKR